MHEGGITQNSHHLAEPLVTQGLAHAVSYGHRSPHAHAGIHGGKRRQKTKGVAAYITGYKDIFHFGQPIKKATVRTACAHVWRPHGQFQGGKELSYAFWLNGLTHQKGVEFALGRNDLLAHAVYAHSLDVQLQKGIKFLYDYELVNFSGKFFNKIFRQGPHHTQLQHRCLGKGLLDIVIGNASTNKATFVFTFFNAVYGQGLRKFKSLLHPFCYLLPAHTGIAWEHNQLGRNLLDGGFGFSYLFSHGHYTLHVGNTGGNAKEHGGVQVFA